MTSSDCDTCPVKQARNDDYLRWLEGQRRAHIKIQRLIDLKKKLGWQLAREATRRQDAEAEVKMLKARIEDLAYESAMEQDALCVEIKNLKLRLRYQEKRNAELNMMLTEET